MFLFRLVDVVNELFAMSASISRAVTLQKRGAPEAAAALEAAEHFCKQSRRVVRQRFHELWHNDDDAKVAFSRQVLKGEHTWLEEMYNGVNGTTVASLGAGGDAKPKGREATAEAAE